MTGILEHKECGGNFTMWVKDDSLVAVCDKCFDSFYVRGVDGWSVVCKFDDISELTVREAK